ncbi:MAG: hypothetical protein HGB18_03110 [Candidatus Moranbacteria bacterium]|nr:hypothetical protein [Candidatus Moranbacteria bacterium]
MKSKVAIHSVNCHPVIKVGMPSIMRIELVQGNDLRSYEIFSGLASICLSTAVSFWTAYLSLPEPAEGALLFSAICFSLFTVVLVGFMVYFWKKVHETKSEKTIEMTD